MDERAYYVICMSCAVKFETNDQEVADNLTSCPKCDGNEIIYPDHPDFSFWNSPDIELM